jgi:hypothetical protein
MDLQLMQHLSVGRRKMNAVHGRGRERATPRNYAEKRMIRAEDEEKDVRFSFQRTKLLRCFLRVISIVMLSASTYYLFQVHCLLFL